MTESAPPASLAFTSRDLFLGVALVAVLLGVYSTFGWFYAAPLALAISIALFYWGHRTRRRPYVWAARIIMLPAACVSGVAFFAVLLLGVGPVYTKDKWPDHVYYFARIAETDTSNVKVSSLAALIDSEYVWRQPFPSGKLPKLIADYQLESIALSDASPNFFAAFPYLWRPEFGPNCEFYATTEFDPDGRGPDGEHFYVMHDRDRGLLYVWYKDNF